jgi:hypothetical protein
MKSNLTDMIHQDEYTVLEHSDRLALIRDVEGHLAQDWEPLGGVSIAIDPGSNEPMVYAQAMRRNRFELAESVSRRVAVSSIPE